MGFFTGEEIKPVEGRPWFPDLNYGFSKWISDQFYTDPNGRLGLYGANAFNPANDPSGAIASAMDYLRVPSNQRLNQSWDAWQPWDAGTQYMANYLQNGSQADPGIVQQMKNTQQYGGIGGYGTDLMHSMAQQGAAGQYPAQLMHNMAQYGGTGGQGNYGMSYAMQYGAPSQAGQYVANQAQFGVASEGSGRPLQNRAYGQQSPSLSYLQPFMEMASRSMNYQGPSIPTRQLYRNDGSGPVRLAPPVGYNLPGPYGASGQTPQFPGTGWGGQQQSAPASPLQTQPAPAQAQTLPAPTMPFAPPSPQQVFNGNGGPRPGIRQMLGYV